MNFITGWLPSTSNQGGGQSTRVDITNAEGALVTPVVPEVDDTHSVGAPDKRFSAVHTIESNVQVRKTDFTDISAPIAKNVCNVGDVIQLTASENLQQGDLVVYTMGQDLELKCVRMSSVTTPNYQFAGVCMSDTQTNDTANVMTRGITTVKYSDYIDPPNQSDEVRLNTSSNGTTVPVYTIPISFRDSGGLPLDYQNSESYVITFQAQPGRVVELEFIDWSFEHGTYNPYDRLTVEFATEDGVFQPASVDWWGKDNGSGGFLGSSISSTGTKGPGWLVPKDEATGNTWLTNGQTTYSKTVQTNVNQVRFTFFSDNSSSRPGWDIKVYSPIPVPEPMSSLQPLYAMTTNDGQIVSTRSVTNANNTFIGFNLGIDTTDNSVLAMIRP